MKKLIICLLSLMMLAGCAEKTTWEDVESNFVDAGKEVDEIAKNIEVISEDDYQALLVELNDYVDDIEFSQDQDNQDLLRRTYKVAQYIEVFASLFEGNAAQQLLALASNSKDLIKSVYSGNKDDFNAIKDDVKNQIGEISSWADDQWNTVIKKAKLVWDEVSSKIEELEEDAKDNLVSFEDVTEYELDELKHTIIDNYELIKDGVTEDTNKIAQDMFVAAVQLQAYTRKINNDAADKVYDFAKHTQSYIKRCYGKVLEDGEELSNNFEEDVASAKKWTQSTWNEITKGLKLLSMPEKE